LPRIGASTKGTVRTPRLAEIERLPISSATKKIGASAQRGLGMTT